jgi:Domain of unknown function (DUF4276)
VTPRIVTIASIVEGHGEVSAFPKLLHRMAQAFPMVDLRTPKPPWRRSRGSLVAAGGIEREVESNSWVGPSGGILVLLDADDDCPAELAPALLNRAQSARPDRRVSVVLAKREFEAWFLASAPSLAGSFGFQADMATPDDPEGVRGAKEWLSRHRPRGHPYKETVDQAVLASAFDIGRARKHSPSFDKFCREIEALLSPP